MNSVDVSVRSFIRRTGAPLKKMVDALQMTPAETLSWFVGQGPLLRECHLLSLASFLGVSPDDVYKESYNLSLVRTRLIEGATWLPDKYAENAFSFVRTSAYIIDFISLYHGTHFRDRLLSHMGVHPTYFDNLDNRISLRFLSDLMTELQSVGFCETKLATLGHLCSTHLKETEFIRVFDGTTSYGEFWDKMMLATAKLDANFIYRGQPHLGHYLLEVSPSENLKEAISKNRASAIDPGQFVDYRKSLLEAYPIMAGLDMQNVEIIGSMKDGAKADTYRIQTPDSAMPKLFILKQPSSVLA